MIIELHNIRAKVVSALDEEHRWVTDFLSWADDKAWIRKWKGYNKSANDFIRLYSRVDDTYPAGFTGMLVKAAKEAGHTVVIVDKRVRPGTLDGTQATGTWRLPLPPGLRDYQVEAVEACVKRTRGVVWAATGAGKTQVAMGLVESVPVRWLFLVNQTQLGLQARDRFRQFSGMEAGVIAEGEWNEGTVFTVATFQTLYAKLKKGGADGDKAIKFLESVEGVIVDEAHVLPADSFRKVLESCPAYYRLGLSATPLSRGDRKGMHLIGCLGSVIYRISAKTLIEAKILAKPIIKLKPHHQESDKATWQGAYSEIVAKGKERNKLICTMADLAAKPAVVFFKDLTQGKLLEKALTKMGHKVEYVDGTTPTAVRQAMVTRLERGDTDILVASVVMNQGIDVPELRAVVMAAGGASVIATLQRVGRGMRRTPTKDTFEVWDVKDTGNKWTAKHAKERLAAYASEEYEVEELP